MPPTRRRIEFRQVLQLLRSAVEAWIDDRAASMGAALAYYTLFSMAPLLLIAVSVAGLVFGVEAARGEVFAQLRGIVGEGGAAAVEQLLESVDRPGGGLLSTVIGLGLMLVGATTVFAELQDALDRIWRAPGRPPGGPWALLRARVSPLSGARREAMLPVGLGLAAIAALAMLTAAQPLVSAIFLAGAAALLALLAALGWAIRHAAQRVPRRTRSNGFCARSSWRNEDSASLKARR